MVANLLWYLQRLDWVDALDILLVAFTLFWLLYFVRGTRAVPLLRGVIILLIIITPLSGLIRLRAFGWLTQKALPALLVAIPVVFQQELRHALERLGRTGALFSRTTGSRAEWEHTLSVISESCRTLSERRHGALIVLERETGLQELIDSGVFLDAAITSDLLITIFDPHTMLHDGAVIIRDGRIEAAACVLPLSTAFLADRQLGLRHRAGIGVTEESDAVAIVVSEERGSISITHNGRIIRNLDAKRLEAVLMALFQPALERVWPQWIARIRRFLGRYES
ncbi:MAG: TIGR00159 family protein [Chloroflexi bacterium]|nr:MAG: TIGR00159 family protein [Chloroflexota bacterium]